MHSFAVGAMSRKSLRLTLSIIVFTCAHSLSSRSLQPPYPMSHNIDQVSGSATTYGPTDSIRAEKLVSGNFYRTLTLHDGKLFVGGKAQLFSADPATLTTLFNMSIPKSSNRVVSYCPHCGENYIRIIQPLSRGSLLECGTNAITPYCQQRSANSLEPLGMESRFFFRGVNVVPSLPHQNSSWLLLGARDAESEYRVFAGTNLVNSFGTLGEPAIVRANLRVNSPQIAIDVSLKTKDYPNTVLNEPQFVGDPIEYNEHIFFFYREFASEHMNAGRAVYSRVAMVCKDELGGQRFTTFTDKEMVTFVKARLDCSIDGEFPYHYNEIQDIYQSTVNPEVVFAAFATGPTGVASSAVCAYRLDEIEELFNQSSFRAQRDDMLQWMELIREPIDPRPATCPDTTAYSDADYKRILALAQLMTDSAENSLHYENRRLMDERNRRRRNGIGPLLIANGERFSQIVVDEGGPIDVMFLGTENGTVLKAYLVDDRSEARIVEEISLNTGGMKTPVLTLLKSDEDGAVFAGTDVGVYKIPLQHCQDYTTCQACLDTRDPYCKWVGGSCRNSRANGLQDLEYGSSERCPSTAHPDDEIVIHRLPKSQRRALNIPNQPVHLYLLAEGPEARNLRLVAVDCSPCAGLPFTQFKSPARSGREYLVAHIDGSSQENANCSCVCELEMDGGTNRSDPFTLIADNSEVVTASESDIRELSVFDYNVAGYKYAVEKWNSKVAESCGLEGLQECSSGGRSASQPDSDIPPNQRQIPRVDGFNNGVTYQFP